MSIVSSMERSTQRSMYFITFQTVSECQSVRSVQAPPLTERAPGGEGRQARTSGDVTCGHGAWLLPLIGHSRGTEPSDWPVLASYFSPYHPSDHQSVVKRSQWRLEG